MNSTPEMTKKRLLLADDSVTIRKVVELTFADEGIEVISVGDGDAAMQKFVEQTPDIVLVDVEMPGPSGYQICEMIKGDEATRDIPVLLLVGSFEPFDQTEAERVHADGYLTKPFHSIRDLVLHVSDLLENKAPLATGPENEDIEELYSSSFAETMPLPIHEEDTEENPLRDVALDDEMVETIQNADAIAVAETIEASRDFDWSPAAMVDNGSVNGSAPAMERVVDGEAEPEYETAFSDEAYTETDDDTGVEIQTAQSPEPESDQEPMAEAAAAGSEVNFAFAEGEIDRYMEQAFNADIHDSKADTEEIAAPFVKQAIAEAERSLPAIDTSEAVHETLQPESFELTEAEIELIARRVVEKLSDHIIRDIARDAVPRIAEKLIREALDQDKKTQDQ